MSADSLAGHVQNFFFILKVMVPHATVAIHCLVRLFSLLGTTVSIAWHSRFLLSGTMIVPIEDKGVYVH